MSTHRVTLDLPKESYECLQQMVESGEFASESDAVANVLLQATLPDESIPPGNGRSYDDWIRDEAIAAYKEYKANPSDVYTTEEVLAHLNDELHLHEAE